jgi:serine/threonine protein phosphatase PrpC
MCLVTGETLDVFNLGDSRAYQFIKSKKKWDKLTVDQTVENLIETEYAKKLSKIKKESENIKEDTEFVNAWFKNQKTKFHDSLHAITHCIDDISVIHKDFDHFVYQIHKGDILFLASDGCYHWTEREDINSLVSKSKKFDGVSKSLTELAIKNGSDDNSTAIVVLAE